MSIYGSRRDRSLDHDLAWERILLKVGDSQPDPQPDPTNLEDAVRLRKASPLDYLLPASLDWLKRLPDGLRPIALATQYPRIVNLLAQQWNDPTACRAYFDELLVGRRPTRQGFPADVRRDIWELREHFMHSRMAAGGDSAIVK